jgi:6-phosphofructokinase 1
MSNIKRIGILTGGGDCPGLNAVIRAITKPAIQEFGMDVIGFEDGYLGLIEQKFLNLSNNGVSGILTRGGTILGTSNRANPFQYPVLKKGETIYRDVSKEVLRNFKKMNLEGLIAIGGDGTLKIAYDFFKMGMRVVGVPKTIDNDLDQTDLTFGFDSAVSVATEAVDRLHTTAESHDRVMVLEVMGRYAGWIALYAGVAGGGDVVLIPEIPFDIDRICAKIKERVRNGKRFSIVVVAEGAFARKGKQVVMRMVKESTDPVRLGGIGAQIAQQIEESTDLEARFIVLGHLQRGGPPTPFDRLLATRFGYEALQLLLKGHFGQMVALRGNQIKSVSLAKSVGRLKQVPKDHPLIKTARALGTSFGD